MFDSYIAGFEENSIMYFIMQINFVFNEYFSINLLLL